MTTRRLFFALLSLAAAIWLPVAASAVCSTGLANETSSDFETFGLNANGSRSWVGQRFDIDCDAQFMTVRFQITLGLLPVNGVDPLTAGQVVVCTVMDDQNRNIASANNVVEGGLAPQWVEFDFSTLGLGLAAGTLGVKLETPADGYAYVQTDNDQISGNMMISDGTNIFNSLVRDATVAVVWDANSGVVANEVSSWGAIKAMFRDATR